MTKVHNTNLLDDRWTADRTTIIETLASVQQSKSKGAFGDPPDLQSGSD